LSARVAARVLAPVLVPVRVRVRAPATGSVTGWVSVKLTGPLPLASIAPAAAPVPRVNCRLVETEGPVYWRVPPLSTRLVAAAGAAPMPLLAPPLASRLVLSVPAPTVVAPV